MLKIRQVLKQIYRKQKSLTRAYSGTPEDFSKLLALHFFTLTLTTSLKLRLKRKILNGTPYNYGENLYL